ncbi:NAD(P)-dependent oxidoreductase [Streptomyces lomondensis]|uniref:NAD(P)-dependent oxidoreductase n=1 Tax=Streptomyces lomondensis TaxID=68229 RepID=UPI001671FE36|nr:NAD(P)-binding domain-containing protein [Streptomyces lomondensis]MCF0076621.1 NAD(P)-binding domain-containing protein [Streptomyces lomondensis]
MSTSVTVIGLGPMGRAMGGAYLDAGYRVTVWNRTASRADELVARGAVRAATVEEALAANEVVVLSLTGYAAMYAVLEPAAAALEGRVLVNLSSDTPENTRAGAVWAARHGARHLTGGVQTPPSGIGSPEFDTFYSGPRDLFERYEDVLKVLTGTDYRGEDPGLAALYYQLQMDLFWTTLTAWLHMLALADANGIKPSEITPYAAGTLGGMGQFLDFYTPRIEAGRHSGDVERISMAVASLDHVVHTTRDSGVDPALPAAVLETFRRGAAEGYEEDSLTRLVEVFGGGAAA